MEHKILKGEVAKLLENKGRAEILQKYWAEEGYEQAIADVLEIIEEAEGEPIRFDRIGYAYVHTMADLATGISRAVKELKAEQVEALRTALGVSDHEPE